MIAPATYEVVVREYLEKSVFVSAQNEDEALVKVEDAYASGDIILTSDNYYAHGDIELLGVSDEDPEF